MSDNNGALSTEQYKKLEGIKDSGPVTVNDALLLMVDLHEDHVRRIRRLEGDTLKTWAALLALAAAFALMAAIR